MNTYKVKQIKDGNTKIFKVIEVRNPHVPQHHGYFTTRKAANAALRKIAWGETVRGDYED